MRQAKARKHIRPTATLLCTAAMGLLLLALPAMADPASAASQEHAAAKASGDAAAVARAALTLADELTAEGKVFAAVSALVEAGRGATAVEADLQGRLATALGKLLARHNWPIQVRSGKDEFGHDTTYWHPHVTASW